MANWITKPVLCRRIAGALKTAAVALLVGVCGALPVTTGAGDARADGIYIGGGGVGVVIGSGGYRYRGYRGAFFFGPSGFSGPPFLPYGAPGYYHPYDRRAYPYRSRIYPNRSRAYVAPRRYVGQPQRVPPTKTGLAPFTPAWTAYCARKFKSFNPNTGTYLAYSGKYRFCR